MATILHSSTYKATKFLLLLFGFLFIWDGFSQNKIAEEVQKLQQLNTAFVAVSPLTVDSSISKTDINQAVTDATVAKINRAEINQIAAGGVEFLELSIPYQNQVYRVLLYRVNPFTKAFIIVALSKGIAIRLRLLIFLTANLTVFFLLTNWAMLWLEKSTNPTIKPIILCIRMRIS
jgi:hypothetical protein